MQKAVLILASRSPRRRALLEQLGIPHEVRPSAVEERPEPGELPAAYAERLAREKALDVSRTSPLTALGADTIVVIDGRILEQPRDDGDAYEMLSRLSGRAHLVITGVALARGGALLSSETSVTEVHFRGLSETELRRYIASGEGRDKAGAYGAQGLGGGLIEKFDGDYGTVVGLPLALTVRMLKTHGVIDEWPLG